MSYELNKRRDTFSFGQLGTEWFLRISKAMQTDGNSVSSILLRSIVQSFELQKPVELMVSPLYDAFDVIENGCSIESLCNLRFRQDSRIVHEHDGQELGKRFQ